MHMTIRAEPIFGFTLSMEQLNILLELSACHYDGVCKAAAKQGGFLYGWKNRMTWAVEECQAMPAVSATRDQLDITLKILEMINYIGKEDLMLKGVKMSVAFRSILDTANEVVPTWAMEGEVC